MKILSSNEIHGDIVNLKITNKNHIRDNKFYNELRGDDVTSSFAEMFNKAISNVNNLELKATELTNKMVVNPESVNIHDVQIAAEEAEMAILLTKGIVDRVIRAYKEIVNLR